MDIIWWLIDVRPRRFLCLLKTFEIRLWLKNINSSSNTTWWMRQLFKSPVCGSVMKVWSYNFFFNCFVRHVTLTAKTVSCFPNNVPWMDFHGLWLLFRGAGFSLQNRPLLIAWTWVQQAEWVISVSLSRLIFVHSFSDQLPRSSDPLINEYVLGRETSFVILYPCLIPIQYIPDMLLVEKRNLSVWKEDQNLSLNCEFISTLAFTHFRWVLHPLLLQTRWADADIIAYRYPLSVFFFVDLIVLQGAGKIVCPLYWIEIEMAIYVHGLPRALSRRRHRTEMFRCDAS